MSQSEPQYDGLNTGPQYSELRVFLTLLFPDQILYPDCNTVTIWKGTTLADHDVSDLRAFGLRHVIETAGFQPLPDLADLDFVTTRVASNDDEP